MTKFEISDAMVEAAQAAKALYWFEPPAQNISEGEAMRAAITAAIEASGLVEENARLRDAGEKLALWAYEEADVDPDATPGLRDMLNLTGHPEEPCPFPPAINKEPTL